MYLKIINHIIKLIFQNNKPVLEESFSKVGDLLLLMLLLMLISSLLFVYPTFVAKNDIMISNLLLKLRSCSKNAQND